LNLSSSEVVVCSTGLIGELLPMEKIEKGIAAISLDNEGFESSASAIMTTDQFLKK